jgi:hypothetical protein
MKMSVSRCKKQEMKKKYFYNDKKVDFSIILEYFAVMFEKRTLRIFSFLILVVVLATPVGYVSSQQGKGIVLEEIEIKGKIQKPEAMYFLSRSRFDYRTLDLDISFLDKVEKALHVDEAF